MLKELDAILDHIHYCLKSTDASNAQYLIPAFKLLRNCYMSDSELLVTESTLTLFSDTIQYIIQTSKNMSCDKRVLSECSLVLSQTIYCLHKKNRLSTLLANSKTLEELVASLISLLSSQRESNSVCTTILLVLDNLHSDSKFGSFRSFLVIHLPKPILTGLCQICSYILSQPDQYTTDVLALTLSLVAELLQLCSLSLDAFTCSRPHEVVFGERARFETVVHIPGQRVLRDDVSLLRRDSEPNCGQR